MRTGSWLGLDSNLKKGLSWFAAGHPVCFLVISTSSFPPTKQLRLNPTSKYCRLSGGTAHTAQNTSPRMKKRNIDLLPIKSCQKESLFRHSSAPFAFSPPYRDLFSLNLHSLHLTKDPFSIFKRWGQDVKDGQGFSVLEKPLRTHTHTFALSVHSDLSRWG